MNKFTEIIEQSMKSYAGAVLQSRALVDVRDGLKPSARQIFYSMLLHKLVHKNPYKKTANAVGMAMADFYIHGDSSCEGVIMRAGQTFAMRYPLIEVKGNAGTLIESGNWAAMRYTESRLSALSNYLFADIDKDTIKEWRDNYDNTKQFPAVLPSKGFYNIVNGTSGIGIGLASSIPQFNLKELNNALIHLIDNPDCDFDAIYCAPDFATGAILYNEKEVKESIKNGHGFACKLRSVVSFDNKERCFVVTEIPYGVYTNTICKELEEIINGESNPGIMRFNDLTGSTPLIKIYLAKNANPDRILKFLFKETSLQYYYGINFTMLDKGRFPKLFTWKEMLQAHIDHEREVYRRGFEFDLNKILARIHIIEGLLICLAHIEEVVAIIKSASSAAAAKIKLMEQFVLDDVQTEAILNMKLSRLAHLEVEKLKTELITLKKEADIIQEKLNNSKLLDEDIKNGWRETSKIFGDARRTQIISLATGNSEDDVIEQKQLSLSFTNEGAIYVTETSSLYSQKRNGVGNKFKLNHNEYIIDNLIGQNTDTILFFTSHGNFYHTKLNNFTINEKQYLSNFVTLLPYEHIIAAAVVNKSTKPHIIFITKNGILKKSELSEYNLKRNVGATAIKLDEGDEIISILFTDSENIGIASRAGNFIMISTSDIRPIGRVARGVSGMKLNEGDEVVAASTIPATTTELISITSDGYIKRSLLSEFKLTGRGTKGVKIQNTTDLSDILPISTPTEVLVVSSNAQIRIKYNDIPQLGRGTQGVKAIKLAQNSKIIKLSAI